MKLSKTSLEIFTSERREEIKAFIISIMKEDKRIASVIQVGSGAFGFIDDYSDIDMAVVTYDTYELMPIFKEWKQKLMDSLEIIHSFEVVFTPESLLMGFLTEDFLELNIGFQDTNNIFAKRKHWKIEFDKTNELSEVMSKSWQKTIEKSSVPRLLYLVSGSWHYINSAIIALLRENLWRSLEEIGNMRRELLEIIAMRYKMKVNYFLDSEHMSDGLRESLTELLVPTLDKRTIYTTIKKLTKLYFKEANETAKNCGENEFSYLEKRMNDYLLIAEKRIFK